MSLAFFLVNGKQTFVTATLKFSSINTFKKMGSQNF